MENSQTGVPGQIVARLAAEVFKIVREPVQTHRPAMEDLIVRENQKRADLAIQNHVLSMVNGANGKIGLSAQKRVAKAFKSDSGPVTIRCPNKGVNHARVTQSKLKNARKRNVQFFQPLTNVAMGKLGTWQVESSEACEQNLEAGLG